jgi:hypothetical protein
MSMLKASNQEIFASFFKEVGRSEAQWYSLKPLHSDIPKKKTPAKQVITRTRQATVMKMT